MQIVNGKAIVNRDRGVVYEYIDIPDNISVQDLVNELVSKNIKPSAAMIQADYDGHLYLYHDRLETDFEMAERIIKEEKEARMYNKK